MTTPTTPQSIKNPIFFPGKNLTIENLMHPVHYHAHTCPNLKTDLISHLKGLGLALHKNPTNEQTIAEPANCSYADHGHGLPTPTTPQSARDQFIAIAEHLADVVADHANPKTIQRDSAIATLEAMEKARPNSLEAMVEERAIHYLQNGPAIQNKPTNAQIAALVDHNMPLFSEQSWHEKIEKPKPHLYRSRPRFVYAYEGQNLCCY